MDSNRYGTDLKCLVLGTPSNNTASEYKAIVDWLKTGNKMEHKIKAENPRSFALRRTKEWLQEKGHKIAGMTSQVFINV